MGARMNYEGCNITEFLVSCFWFLDLETRNYEARRFALQGTMKAARIYGFEKTSKSTDLLRVDEVPIPDIESGELLIRVLLAGLNHGDLHMREDAVQYTSEVPTIPFLPMVIGHDGLGEVV